MCNNYDSFALEEDGRIDVQIAQEYAELNLSNPPAIVRAETTREALELLRSQESGVKRERLPSERSSIWFWNFVPRQRQTRTGLPVTRFVMNLLPLALK